MHQSKHMDESPTFSLPLDIFLPRMRGKEKLIEYLFSVIMSNDVGNQQQKFPTPNSYP